MRVILRNRYKNYQEGLKALNIDKLDTRREKLCLNFAKKCLNNEKVKHMFPKKINNHVMKKRNIKKFKVNFARTKRYKKSAIPFMVELLKKEDQQKKLYISE